MRVGLVGSNPTSVHTEWRNWNTLYKAQARRKAVPDQPPEGWEGLDEPFFGNGKIHLD